ncbi:hypothetical protein JTB14_001486 [Gonioctena quinquepunctata]|nr:hypothetical protein JTB14_001486 [Gonioctena quinquepunctata]
MPKAFRLDESGILAFKMVEYISMMNGIASQMPARYSTEQDGIAARKNLISFESTRCMIIHIKIPNIHRGEATNTSNHLQNEIASEASDSTPDEIWEDEDPKLDHLKIYRLTAYIFVRKGREAN